MVLLLLLRITAVALLLVVLLRRRIVLLLLVLRRIVLLLRRSLVVTIALLLRRRPLAWRRSIPVARRPIVVVPRTVSTPWIHLDASDARNWVESSRGLVEEASVLIAMPRAAAETLEVESRSV